MSDNDENTSLSVDLTEDDHIPPVNQWDATHTKAAERNCHISAARAWMHNAAAANYLYLGYLLHGTKLVLSVVTSSGVGLNLDNDTQWLMILTLVCGIGIFILEGIHAIYKISEKVSQHRSAAAVYSGVCIRLRSMQFTPNSERPPAKKFLAQIIKSINDAEYRSPHLSSCYTTQCLKVLPSGVNLTRADLRGFQTMIPAGTPTSCTYQPFRKTRATRIVPNPGAYKTNYELERYFVTFDPRQQPPV